jgi:hypothetical protein
MDLGGIRLKLAQAQLVCRVTSGDVETYVFAATPGVSPGYCFESASVQSWEAPYTEAIRSSSGLVVSGVQPGTDALIHLESVEGKKIQILTLTHEQVGNLWKGTFAGQERLILTESDVMFDRGTLTLTDIKAERRFGVYPPPDEVTHHGQSLESAADGIFPTYTIQQTVRTVDVRVEAVPTQEHTWLIHLPDDALDGVNDVFLLLNVTCDKAFLYMEDALVADHFYNGEIWEVGLKRFAEMLKRHPLKLVLAPLHEDTDIYLECKPNFVNGIAVALDGVEAIVQYQDNIA